MPKASDLMTKDPACAMPETELRDVAQLMCQSNCGEIPIVDHEQSKKLIGVITDRDITCRTVAQGKNPLELKAKDCMTSSPASVKPNTELQEVTQLMQQEQIRRVPVVDDQGKLIGIVAQADLARKASPQQAAEVVKKVSEPSGGGRR